MYNGEKPSLEELPSSRQLLRSTFIALVSAIAILVTVVLPAEYGIDPTRVGRALGLTSMGEIKNQLAGEAEKDRKAAGKDERSSVVGAILAVIFSPSRAAAAEVKSWKDEISFTLKPGEGIEWKLVMEKGAVAEFNWVAKGARVNFDLHGDGGGNEISYKKGRGSTGAQGKIKAAFKGLHGWFWRNRDRRNVTVILQVRGDYKTLKRTY